jgi:hypothetical protein
MDNNEILYDHYKESFLLSKKDQSDRNKFFIILIVLITLMFLLFIEPDKTLGLCRSFLKENFKIDLSYSVYTIQSLLWVLFYYFTMSYYQKSMYIERQYHYIHKLEEELSKTINPLLNREGVNYLNNYPLFGDFVDFVFKYIFPILNIIIVIIKITNEWITTKNIFNIIINIIFAIAIIIMTVLYLAFLHPKFQNIINKIFNVK